MQGGTGERESFGEHNSHDEGGFSSGFMGNRAKQVNEGVSAKAIGIALGLIFLSVWWIVYSEMHTQVTEITSTSLPMGVIFLLFLLCFGNALMVRYFGKNLLAGPELAIIYTLTAVGSSLAGIGMVGFMMPALANPFYYNNATNHWISLQARRLGFGHRMILRPFVHSI